MLHQSLCVQNPISLDFAGITYQFTERNKEGVFRWEGGGFSKETIGTVDFVSFEMVEMPRREVELAS